MGANFNCMTLKGKPAEIKKRFEEIRQESLYEEGHSYSGGWGMAQGLAFAVPNRVFTPKEAEEWLSDNAQKWEAALAVKLGNDEYMIGAWCSS